MVITGGPGLAFCVGAGVVEVAFSSDCLSASGLAFDMAAGVSLRDNRSLHELHVDGISSSLVAKKHFKQYHSSQLLHRFIWSGS